MPKPFGAILQIPALDSTPAGNPASGALLYARADRVYTKGTAGAEALVGPITKSDIGLGSVDNTSDASKPVSTATQAALDGKIAYDDVVMNTNPFGGRHLYINSVDNAMFLADKRWTVSGTFYNNSDGSVVGPASAGVLATLFDGNYETRVIIPVGQYLIVNINFNGADYSGYPYGYFYVSHYYNRHSASVTCRVYCNYEPQGIGWKDLTVEDLASGTNLIKKIRNGFFALTDVEFTIQAPDTGTLEASPCQIDWNLDRPGSVEMPLIDKFRANNLYQKLTFSTGKVDKASIDPATGTGVFETLALTNALPQSKTHASPDTDSAPAALHHTLGTGPNQAAPGDHTHSAGFVRIGDIIMSGRADESDGFLLCDGRSLLVADYPELHAEIGYTHGGSGTSFNLPNVQDLMPVGAGVKALGSTGGSATKTLVTANLPSHSHGTGTLATATEASHAHGTGTLDLATAAAHDHDASALTTNSGGGHNHSYGKRNNSSLGSSYSAAGSASGSHGSTLTDSDGAHSHNVIGRTGDGGGHSHGLSGSTASAGGHSHGLSGSTGSVGSGTAVDVMNPWCALNFFIRAR